MNKKLIFFLPLALLLSFGGLLVAGLNQDPKQINSPLIGKPLPEFYQANLFNPQQNLSLKDLPKRPFLINVWGSWCNSCKQEHNFLLELAKKIPIVGINYRDKSKLAINMLSQLHNPYVLVISDPLGELALKLGVDGTPETYLIDENGVIRYRHLGVLDQETWQKNFLPLLLTPTK